MKRRSERGRVGSFIVPILGDSLFEFVHPVVQELSLHGHDLAHVQVVDIGLYVALHESAAVVVLDEAHPPAG